MSYLTYQGKFLTYNGKFLTSAGSVLDPTISINIDYLQFYDDATPKIGNSVVVTSKDSWTVSIISDDDSIIYDITPSSGSATAGTYVYFTLNVNSASKPKNATIRFANSGVYDYVNICQDGTE